MRFQWRRGQASSGAMGLEWISSIHSAARSWDRLARRATPESRRPVWLQVAALDPAVPVFSVTTMTEYVDRALEQPKLSMGLMASFGALALLLAAVGIYGVLSYSVSQRTREIGIRAALGASRAEIMQFIMGEGVRPIVAGAVIGMFASLASTRLIRGLLYGVSATDKTTYVLAPAILLAVSLMATFVPARRAARIVPLDALRHE